MSPCLALLANFFPPTTIFFLLFPLVGSLFPGCCRHLNNSTIDVIYSDDTNLSLSANWNNVTSLTQALPNDLVKWKQNVRYFLREKGYHISLVRKLQQAFNYPLMPQISMNYRISSYLGLIIDKVLTFKYI